MTAKTKDIPLYKQPTFDARIRNLSQPFGTGTTPLQRGFMIWDTSQPFPAGYTKSNGPAVVNFLYNPSTVSASYQMADSSAQAALNYPVASEPAQLLVPLEQSVSFSLYFDRTYEMWDGGKPGTASIDFIGVDVDIMAIRQFTGMFAQVYASGSGNAVAPSANQVNTGTTASGGLAQGIMQMTLGYVYFAAPGSGLRYYGFINNWDVEYTHFSQDMRPMRAVVDISWTLLPPPTSTLVSTNAKGAATSQLGNYPAPWFHAAPTVAQVPSNGVGGR